MVTKFVGRIYPNGEFGVARMKQLSPDSSQSIQARTGDSEDVRWQLAMIRQHGILRMLQIAADRTSPPLDSSMLPNSHSSPKVRRGLKGITSYGRKLVRNGAFLLEKEYPKTCLSFLTLTLPSISVEQSIKIGESWAEIVRVFLQRLKRTLVRAGLSGEVVGCVEVQEKRYQSSNVLALHLHLVFVGRHRYQSWAVKPSEFRDMWRSAVCSRCEWAESLDFSSTENVGRVKKSAEGYLGKYMSKGTTLLAALDGEIRAALPNTWYVCTNGLRRSVRNRTLHSCAVGLSLMQLIENSDLSEIVYVKTVEIEIVGLRKIPIGYYGKLTIACREQIERAIRAKK